MKKKTYIFHRGENWYFIELEDDKDAIENAEHNKGTTKVTTLDKRIVWPVKNSHNENN